MARKQTQTRNGGLRARRGAGTMNWVLLLVAAALIATIVVANNHRNTAQQQASTAAPVTPIPVPAAVMDDFTAIPAAVWERVGTTGARPLSFVGDRDTANGKPVVLYIGAGYCPYCAAARWSMVAALARFGTFSGLTLSQSSSADVYPNTPTFSFYHSSYNSPYIEFQPVELASDVQLPNGQYQKLETPTPGQEALIDKYDSPPYVPQAASGGIPFVLVGGRFMWGVAYLPDVLAGRSQGAIAATLPKASDEAARSILADANQLTAAICSLDGRQPKNVCSSPSIVAAIKALPSKLP